VRANYPVPERLKPCPRRSGRGLPGHKPWPSDGGARRLATVTFWRLADGRPSATRSRPGPGGVCLVGEGCVVSGACAGMRTQGYQQMPDRGAGAGRSRGPHPRGGRTCAVSGCRVATSARKAVPSSRRFSGVVFSSMRGNPSFSSASACWPTALTKLSLDPPSGLVASADSHGWSWFVFLAAGSRPGVSGSSI
jgi:hypothetical protein